MKNILLILLIVVSCKSFPQSNCQSITTVPLRTYGLPDKECHYFKDTNNELSDYEGTWKGAWNGKTIFITFKKIVNDYNETLKYNRDFLIGKFKTIDSNGTILFDNLALSDNQSKIRGINFQNITDKYLMWYVDNDLCGLSGDIEITFANAARTQLNFYFHQDNQVLTSDCYFHGWPQANRPAPLPKDNIVLTKQ